MYVHVCMCEFLCMCVFMCVGRYMCVGVHAGMYLCMYHMYVYMCLHTCMYECMLARMHVCVCLLLLYSVNPLRDQATNTMISYHTQSHYPDHILIMSSAWPGTDKNQF